MKKVDLKGTRTITITTIIFFFLLLTGISNQVNAQQKKVVQLSGIILGTDSTSGLPGVHVYVPKRQDGTTSNYLGFFSLPVLVGDSVVFSAIGYKRQSYIVPDMNKQVTVVVEMVTDTTYLETITIMPFPTEEIFKEAVLALNLPADEEVDEDMLNQELLTLMMRSAPIDAQTNYKYYMDQVIYQQQYRYGPRPNPFLNPFNWAKFIRSLKKKKN